MERAGSFRAVGAMTITLFNNEIKTDRPNVLIEVGSGGWRFALGKTQQVQVAGTRYTRQDDGSWQAESDAGASRPSAAGGFLKALKSPTGERLEACGQNLLCQIIEAEAPAEKEGEVTRYVVAIGLFDNRLYRYEMVTESIGFGRNGARLALEFSDYGAEIPISAPQPGENLLTAVANRPMPTFTLRGVDLPARTIATATPNPEVRVEVGSYSVVRDTYGVKIVGYLVNNGTVAAEQLKVAISLLDDAGKTLAAENAIYLRDQLPPGERSPFLVSFSNAPGEWGSERIQVQAKPASGSSFFMPQATGLTITDASLIPPQNRYASPSIVGQVQNRGAKTARSVEVLGIVYDAEDKPVWVGNTYTKLDELAPAETAPFELSLYGAKLGTRFELFVQGRQK